jgi:drug/metabolite transporter (DMT)-like permease
MTARQVLGIALAVLGLAAIAVARAQAAALLPLVLTLVAALGWAFGNLAARLADPPNPLHLTLWMSVVPPIPLLAVSLATEGPAADWAASRAAVTPAGVPGLLALGYLAVLATVLGAGLWTALMRRYPAGVVAPYSLLVPVVGIALAAAALNERPTVVELVAGVVIVGGVLLGTPRPVPAGVVGGLPTATQHEPGHTLQVGRAEAVAHARDTGLGQG